MVTVGRQVVEVGELGRIRDTEGVGTMATWKGFAPSKMARIGLWTSCCNRLSNLSLCIISNFL